MNSTLHKNCVLVLNRNWQAINVTTPAMAFGQMATDAATALDVLGTEHMTPTRWVDWVALPVRQNDQFIGTARGAVRVPTVIVLARFGRVPMKRPKFSLRNIWLRDRGRCQYSGRSLKTGEGDIDHVVPRSRGGLTSWDNCVLADRLVNNRKADRTPGEAGLKLRKTPAAPRLVPVTYTLQNTHEIADWEPFLNTAT